MSTITARKALDRQVTDAVGLITKERSRRTFVALAALGAVVVALLGAAYAMYTRIPTKITAGRIGTSAVPQVGGNVVPPRAAPSAGVP